MVIVVNEEELSAVLGEFARTLTTDFPIEGILEQLVERVVDVLAVTSAGITLMSPGTPPRCVAASSRYPAIGPAAFTFPMREDDNRLGALGEIIIGLAMSGR